MLKEIKQSMVTQLIQGSPTAQILLASRPALLLKDAAIHFSSRLGPCQGIWNTDWQDLGILR